MAIDYIVDYPCEPKRALTTEGIIDRLKGEERARTIIALFRRNGDQRPPSEMGFEFSRSTPDGTEETRVILVQDLLDDAAELQAHAHHCQLCPANRRGKPFGCMGFIQYPISAKSEAWLLNQLPAPTEPLVWLLLKQGIDEFNYDGSSVLAMRQSGEVYFEMQGVMARKLGEFKVSADQAFEMLFLLGHIQPPHAGVLLLFFNVIDREIQADQLMMVSRAPASVAAQYPFLMMELENDDNSTRDFKHFFDALHAAWSLNVRLLLDV
jgi:hypothetical protein